MSDEVIKFEAVKVSWRQDKDGYKLTLAVHPDDAPERLMRSWVGARYAVGMVELGDDEKPVAVEPRVDDDVLYAVKLCQDPAFQAWITELVKVAHRLNYGSDERGARNALCQALGIESRREIPSVRSKFKALVEDYLA